MEKKKGVVLLSQLYVSRDYEASELFIPFKFLTGLT